MFIPLKKSPAMKGHAMNIQDQLVAAAREWMIAPDGPGTVEISADWINVRGTIQSVDLSRGKDGIFLGSIVLTLGVDDDVATINFARDEITLADIGAGANRTHLDFAIASVTFS
jgi:hypothetical protein